tara:strand:- start:452 stop:2842 length:2391 start_codon:yes stop_codon:yes gene_type:complete
MDSNMNNIDKCSNPAKLDTYCGYTKHIQDRSRDVLRESTSQAPPIALWWGSVISRICYAAPSNIASTLATLQLGVGITIKAFTLIQEEERAAIIRGTMQLESSQTGGTEKKSVIFPPPPPPPDKKKTQEEEDAQLEQDADKEKTEALKDEEERQSKLDPKKKDSEARVFSQFIIPTDKIKAALSRTTEDTAAKWIEQWKNTNSLGIFESPPSMNVSKVRARDTESLSEINRRLFDILSKTTNQDIIDIEMNHASENYLPMRFNNNEMKWMSDAVKEKEKGISISVIELGSYINCFIIADKNMDTLYINFQLCNNPEKGQKGDEALSEGTYTFLSQLNNEKGDNEIPLAYCALDDESIFKIIYVMCYMAKTHLNWSEPELLANTMEGEEQSSSLKEDECKSLFENDVEKDKIEQIMKRKIYITGYSVGGAIASLFTLFYSQIRYSDPSYCSGIPDYPTHILPPTSILTTYGSPPSGSDNLNFNNIMIDSVNEKMNNYINSGAVVLKRYISRGDPIPYISMGLQNIGTFTHMGSCCGNTVVRCPGSLNIFNNFVQNLSDGIGGIIQNQNAELQKLFSLKKYDVRSNEIDEFGCRSWSINRIDDPSILKKPDQHADQCGIYFFLPLLELIYGEGGARGKDDKVLPLKRKQKDCNIYLQGESNNFKKIVLYSGVRGNILKNYTEWEKSINSIDDVTADILDRIINNNYYEFIQGSGKNIDELKKEITKISSVVMGQGLTEGTDNFSSIKSGILERVKIEKLNQTMPYLINNNITEKAKAADEKRRNDKGKIQVYDTSIRV